MTTEEMLIVVDPSERDRAPTQPAVIGPDPDNPGQQPGIDRLTGLHDRDGFSSALLGLLVESERQHQGVAVFVLDIDEFRNLNEGLGHFAGDLVLQEVARRLRKSIGPKDCLGRLSGDTFLIAARQVRSREDAEFIANKIRSAFMDPFTTVDQLHFLTISLGVSIYPAHGASVDSLLSHAEAALYAAKTMGKSHTRFFEEQMEQHIANTLFVESALPMALELDQIEICYQPIVDILDRKLYGAEALVRWQHPEMGRISPGDFVAVAEKRHLINPLSEKIFIKACQEFDRLWKKDDSLRLSLNVSPRQFENGHAYEIVSKMLHEHYFPMERITFEITETIMVQDFPNVLRVIESMKAAGSKVALDDFGTGYSSLRYLVKMPVDYLKIDKSFIDDILQSDTQQKVVESIIALARSLDLDVIAEGVEHLEQLRPLEARRCRFVQGYLFSRPLDIEAMADFADNFNRSARR